MTSRDRNGLARRVTLSGLPPRIGPGCRLVAYPIAIAGPWDGCYRLEA
jgi:hypothetical protein